MNFWPFVGVTALLIALFGFASFDRRDLLRHGPAGENSLEITSALTMLVWGPLMGGLYLYFLKKIRREAATVETAFCGFSNRFLHLFLAGFVTSLLTWLGFICLILPGIYLLVAWMFTLPLVIDKQLDFWSAMELSRKVVTKHWFKFLGLGIVLILLEFAGVLALCVGVFVMAPLILASLMYAYEDIFGGTTPATATTPAGAGPSGTVVMPGPPPKPPRVQCEPWSTATKLGLATVALVILVIAASLIYQSICGRRETVAGSGPVAPAAPGAHAGKTKLLIFGPVIERELQAHAGGTNQFLNLTTEEMLTPSPQIAGALDDSQPGGGDGSRDWEALDIPQDSRRYQYISWLRESGADLMFAGDGKIIGFDGVFAAIHGDSSTNWDDWNGLTTGQVRAAVDLVDWELRATKASAHGQPMPVPPATGGSYRSAMQLDSRQYGGPVVSLLTLDQSMNWAFKTRDGQVGILQIAGFTDNPPAVKIRYKLVQQTSTDDIKSFSLASADTGPMSPDTLNARLEAASGIDNVAAKDKALGALAANAASAGEVEILKDSLRQISSSTLRDQAAHESAGLLAAQGLRSQALEIAKTIENDSARDQALSELAR